jgi:outer membrane protein assembly factor BamA
MTPSLLIVAVVGSLPVADKVAAPVEKPPAFVGQIFIIGNEVTPQDVILGQLQLYPGQVLTSADLRSAERQLIWLNLLGVGASATVLDNGMSKYKDIQVTVRETALTHLIFRVRDTVLALVPPP